MPEMALWVDLLPLLALVHHGDNGQSLYYDNPYPLHC